MAWKLRRHKLAVAGGVILVVFYLAAVFCEFLSPYDPSQKDTQRINAPPMRLHWVDANGRFRLRPFDYDYVMSRNRTRWNGSTRTTPPRRATFCSS